MVGLVLYVNNAGKKWKNNRGLFRVKTLEYLQLTKEQKVKGVFINGDENNGEYKRWHENGQLYAHYFYKNGKRDGEFKSWHENGQLCRNCFYKNGELNGEYKNWDGKGQLFYHYFYKNGI